MYIYIYIFHALSDGTEYRTGYGTESGAGYGTLRCVADPL